MRSIKNICVVLGAALILTGCAPSLHPFYDEKDVVFNGALLGSWISGSGEKLTFTKSGEDHYDLLYVDEDAPARFEARLVELDGVTFLDLYPHNPDNANGLFMANIVKGHMLGRVVIGEKSLSIALMDDNRLRELSDRRELGLAHERIADGSIVLTAPTSELQAFVLRTANDEEVFGAAEIFRRLKPGN